MLHLRSTRRGRSAAASTVALCPVWAAYAQEAPSAADRTPPLAIYVRLVALFLFWRWFSMRSFLTLLTSRTAFNIATSYALIIWPRAYPTGLSGLYMRCLR